MRSLGPIGAGVMAVLLSWRTAQAQPTDSVLVLDVRPGAAEIDREALRSRLSTELGIPVVAATAETVSAVGRLVVDIDRTRHELVVEFRRQETVSLLRRLSLPAEQRALQQTLVFLAGNMVRDEAHGVLRELAPSEEPPSADRGGERSPPNAAAAASPPEPAPRRYWVGFGAEGAFGIVQGASDPCGAGGGGTSGGFYCVTSDGADISENPPGAPPVDGGKISSGVALASTRFSLSLDIALDDNWLVGGRFGGAVHRYPGSAARTFGDTWGWTHLEAHATYVFGARALVTTGFRWAATLAAGVGEWDTSTRVTMSTGNPLAEASYDAWRIHAGPFASAAFGAWIVLGERSAIRLSLAKFTLVGGAISENGVDLFYTPEIAGEVGF